MITIRKSFTTSESYDLSRIGDTEKLVFFDIETTGFSGDWAQVYLIGCTWKTNQEWQLIQWFADSAGAEADVLKAFFQFIQSFSILVHFNGDGFDIPFLLKRCAGLGLPYDFSTIESFDIYKKIRPFRKILGMEQCKQKSIEAFLGISRKDLYSGGQLIEVYQNYLQNHDPYYYDLLLLHNEDDLKGMPAILPILNYPDFFSAELLFCGFEHLSETDIFGDSIPLLCLTYESPDIFVPVDFSYEKDGVSCSVEGNRISFTIELYQGTLKHYFDNYKDYYYLIYEDTAVHKSVGEFVEKSARKKATANTCYIRQTGCFLPEFGDCIWEPILKKERKSKISYVPLESICFDDCACMRQYEKQLLSFLGIS